MTVKALKKNNMERKSTNGGFKMKSGNKPDMQRLAGISPMKDNKKKTTLVNKAKALAKAVKDNALNVDDSILGTISDYKKNKQELRNTQVDK